MAKANKSKSVKTKKPASLKDTKLFQNLQRSALQYMQGKAYRPMKPEELIAKLNVIEQHCDLFQEVLDDLVEQRKLEHKNGQYHLRQEDILIAPGVIRMHPRGFGFVQLNDPSLFAQDIFIPKPFTQGAIDGDTVEVEINLREIGPKGPDGQVLSIIKRNRTHLVGTISTVHKLGSAMAYVPLLGGGQEVVVQFKGKDKLSKGERVSLEVLEWGSKHQPTVCQAVKLLGHIDNPSSDVNVAIAEFDLRSEFSPLILEEAEKLGTRVSTREIANRRDLRDLEIFTIDPETAKDFDDALNLTKDAKGHYHLGVHIADVSHYVRPGTALDVEAQLRCNSTYFPGYCLPMLPSVLSDNLCSLKPKVNRLTVSVFMEFDPHGHMVHYEVARTVIRSAMRFSYEQAKEVLDGKRKSEHAPTLKLMVELCGLLKRKRSERGSVEFSLPELVIRVDKEGVPQGTQYIEYDITHQLVEEFMVKANEVVATHVNNQGRNLTYRIHDEPSEDQLRDFAALAESFGFKLSQKPTPVELQQLFEEAGSTSYGPYLATRYIRSMRLACYSVENIGHYGLGLTHYCHFTSPIRRYVDLVAHRILFGESDDLQELQRTSTRCSDRERISAKAENQVTLLKKLRYLEKIHQESPGRFYDAVVTSVKPFGLFFELIDFMIEGFLHISELGHDYYNFNSTRMQLEGSHRGGVYGAGVRISVKLKEIDLTLLETQWALESGVEGEQVPRRKEKSSGKHERRRKEKRKEKRK